MATTFAYGSTDAQTLKDRLAQRTSVFGDSIWTDIFEQFKKHDDPIYFGDGAPAPELIPVERLKEASIKAWDDAPACLGYGDQKGYPALREWIVGHVAKRGITCSADDVLITNGATQALDVACRALLEPGDTIIVENPTFLGAIEIFQTYEVEMIGIDGDEHGMDIDALQRVLESGVHPKLIYTIPTFQNPSGTTMPLDRRQRMVELATQYNVAIFEDDPYCDLQYSGDVIPPIRSLNDHVLHFGTFSKTIAPGIRVGYAIASPDVMDAMLAIREVTDISNERIMMRTVYHCAEGFLDDHVQRVRTVYASRRDTMLAALDEHMPEGVTWSRPDGGYFVWITLPESVRHVELFDEAAMNGVIFFPGEWFDPQKTTTNTMRLSFSTVPEERIRIGIERLGKTVRAHLASSVR